MRVAGLGSVVGERCLRRAVGIDTYLGVDRPYPSIGRIFEGGASCAASAGSVDNTRDKATVDHQPKAGSPVCPRGPSETPSACASYIRNAASPNIPAVTRPMTSHAPRSPHSAAAAPVGVAAADAEAPTWPAVESPPAAADDAEEAAADAESDASAASLVSPPTAPPSIVSDVALVVVIVTPVSSSVCVDTKLDGTSPRLVPSNPCATVVAASTAVEVLPPPAAPACVVRPTAGCVVRAKPVEVQTWPRAVGQR